METATEEFLKRDYVNKRYFKQTKASSLISSEAQMFAAFIAEELVGATAGTRGWNVK